jgi:hypothetical protein
MAAVETPLLRKLKKGLTRAFPAPAVISLQDDDGIIGVIAAERFAELDTLDRQDLIGNELSKILTPAELRHIQAIVGVTPLEEAGFQASKARPARLPSGSHR